jgi:hypothetical protein
MDFLRVSVSIELLAQLSQTNHKIPNTEISCCQSSRNANKKNKILQHLQTSMNAPKTYDMGTGW